MPKFPLQLKWLQTPVKILGIHVSYDEKGNIEWNFNLKTKKAANKTWYLESERSYIVWQSNDLKITWIVTTNLLILDSQHSWRFRQLFRKLFKFLWKNKRDKIKRSGLYQDLEKGGLRMIDIEIMFKALKLAWIPRLLSPGRQNCRTVPDYSWFSRDVKKTKIKNFKFLPWLLVKAIFKHISVGLSSAR